MPYQLDLNEFANRYSAACDQSKQLLVGSGGQWSLSAEYELVNLELLERTVSGSLSSFYQLPYFLFLRRSGFGKNSKLISESLWCTLISDSAVDTEFFESLVGAAIGEVFSRYSSILENAKPIPQLLTHSQLIHAFITQEMLQFHAEAAFSAGRCGTPIQREATCLQHEMLLKQCDPELYHQLGWHYERFLEERFDGELVTRRAFQGLRSSSEIEIEFAEQWLLYLSQIASKVGSQEGSISLESLQTYWRGRFQVL
jgi:hypothetical protein